MEASDYNKIIAELSAEMQGIRSVSFISSDGLLLATNANDIQPDKLAALSAATLGLAKKSASEMSFGQLKEIQIVGSEASYLIYSIDEKRILTVVVSEGTNVGMLNILIRKRIATMVT